MESILTSFLVDFYKSEKFTKSTKSLCFDVKYVRRIWKKNTNVGLGILLIFQVIAHLQWHTVFENK